MRHIICDTCGTFMDLRNAKSCPVCAVTAVVTRTPVKVPTRHRKNASKKKIRPYGYSAWKGMIGRCHNANHPGYRHYGARGISVCREWRNSLDAFVRDMGERPRGYTIERKDNDGDYTPDNCKWATYTEQARNKRNNLILTCNGRTQLVVEWCEQLNLPYRTIVHRIEAGWTDEETLLTPIGSRKFSPARESAFSGAQKPLPNEINTGN